MRRLRPRGDDGATAALTAILAVVLFGFAALAVEITDMYSRDSAAQTTADLSALAGAQGLPEACTAFSAAFERLGDESNGIRNDTGDRRFDQSAAVLSNRNLADGEIQVLTALPNPSAPPTSATDPTWLDTSACGATGGPTTARFLRVVTPPRTKDFALAAALPGAPDQGQVRAAATVALRSPSYGDILPVFLPDGCVSGAKKIITDSPGQTTTTVTPNYDPNGAAGQRNAPVVDSVTSSDVIGGIVQQVTVTLSNLRFDPAAPVSPATSTVVFDFHNGSGNDTERYPESAPAGVPPLSMTPVSTAGTGADQRWVAEFEVRLPNEITSVGGDWWVRALETSGTATDDGWTRADDATAFSVNALSAPGCNDPSTGDFGFLRADRNDTGNSSAGEMGLNFIEGLDFSISAIPVRPPVGTACTADGTPQTALLSTVNAARDGANCLAIESGRNGGNVTDGLIEGEGSKPGRLQATGTVSPPTNCPEPGDSTPDYTWTTPTNPAVSIWNTQLSCYLPGGESLAQLETCDGCLDGRIVEDPRYFLVPVLNETTRPSSSSQWPIKEFRGAFITNEANGALATCSSDRVCNGLEFNDGLQTVFSVQVFVFPLSALPDEVPVSTGDGSEYTGVGPKDFVLVE